MWRRRLVLLTAGLAGLALCASAANATVLRVGAWNGIQGQFKTIQGAARVARPGDWILVGPGDYKTHSSRHPAGVTETPAGILITKKNLRLRGMNRNTVIVDGTKSGAPCSRQKSASWRRCRPSRYCAPSSSRSCRDRWCRLSAF